MSPAAAFTVALSPSQLNGSRSSRNPKRSVNRRRRGFQPRSQIEHSPHCSPIPRRAVLLGLAGLALAPVITSAAEKENEEKPLTGFLSKSGLKYYDFERGTGRTPKWGDLVNIQYTIYTVSPDEKRLIKRDSSYDFGEAGYLIHHGNGEHIIGLEEAIHSMSVGGRRRCIIPQNIGYWKQDVAPIPMEHRSREAFFKALTDGDGSVVLDVEVREIWEDPDDRGYYDDLVPTDDEIMQTFKEQQGIF